MFDGKCVFNHESKHGPNGELVMMSMNLFNLGIINDVDKDGELYLIDYANTCLKNVKNGTFKWDIIE